MSNFAGVIKYSEVAKGDDLKIITGSFPPLYVCGVIIPFPPEVLVSYQFSFSAVFFNDNPGDTDLFFYVEQIDESNTNIGTGEIYSVETVKVPIAAGETKTVTVSISFTAPGGAYAGLILSTNANENLYIKPGLTFRADPNTQCFVEGDTVEIKDCINPDYTLMELTKGAIHLINGATDTNLSIQSLEIVPENDATVYGQTVPGYIIKGQVFDISPIVVDGSIKDTPKRAELKRYTRIGFKDSTDAYIAQNEAYEAEPAHSRLINNGADLPDDVTEFYNPFFEPSIEKQDFRLKGPFDNRTKPPMLPAMHDNTTGARSFNIGPRVFFNMGKRTQLNPNASDTVDDVAGFMFNSSDEAGILTFGYATQLRTWELLNYGIDGNVVYGNNPTDLFNLFYLGFFQEQQYSRINNLLLTMNMTDYVNFRFRGLYYYTDRGRSVYAKMRAINDFAAGAKLSTPVDFLRSPALSACCDLPCGCRFLECEYYMDFGPQIRQSTLDTLKISSFKVDGKELLSADLSLGLKNVIIVNGRQYVTNLIDALNTVGAPYFIFSYSTRVSTLKGLRFFKIKRPACQAFEIIIEQSGSEVYRYTQDIQEQKWFGASFEPFGYGAEEYGEPENCVNTIEY